MTMQRSMVFLIGSAILAAVMAGFYYAPDSVALKEDASAYNLGPGEVQLDAVHPSLPGSDIVYEVVVKSGEIDLYVLEQEWATPAAGGGAISLAEPFSYDAAKSATHINGSYTFTIQSDGKTSYIIFFDNSDNFYEGDAGEGVAQIEDARVQVSVRFVAEEARSLTLGYMATVPSILLVVVTFGRQAMRWQRERKQAHQTIADESS